MDHGYAVAKLKMGVIGVTVEIMSKDAKMPADITVLNKTEAAAVLPDLFAAPVEAAPAAETEAPVEEGQ